MSRALGRWVLLLGALLFAVLGQLYFAKRPQYFWDAVLFYAVAAICLLLLVRPAAPEGVPATPALRGLVRGWQRAALLVLSLILTTVVVLRLTRPQQNYWPIFWTWLAAMALCLIATLPHPRGLAVRIRAIIAAVNPWEAAAVLALLIFALALRVWRIDTLPWTLSGDEGNFGRWAREVFDGRLINMFSTGHLSMPSLYAFFQAAWLKLAGDNIFGLRLPWAILGALSVFGTYLLVRRLFGRNLAMLVSLLLAGYHYHIHYSRLGLNNMADPFFVAWTLYLLVVAVQDRRRWAWALTGLMGGLAFYFYTGGRQVPVILVGVLVWAALLERDFLRKHRAGLVIMVVALLVAVGPMALYAVQHPDDFNARINQVGIVQSGWLARESEMLGQTQLQVLAGQFRKVFFAFTQVPDRTDFYKPSIPLLDFPSAIFFMLGIVLALARSAERPVVSDPDAGLQPGGESLRWRYAVFVIWFFAVIITGGVLTDTAPSSQRILSSSIPAMFFVAVALWELVRAFAALISMPAFGRYVLTFVVAAALTLGSIRYYFGKYQDSWVYGSFNAEVSTRIGYYMADLGPDWEQYFMGAPRMWAEFGSATFISTNPYLDVIEPLVGPPAFVDPNYNAAFIILPERESDLLWLQQAYPDGQLEEVHRVGDTDGPLLFTAYKVMTKSSS